MTSAYQKRLFTTYSKTHVAHLDLDDQDKLDWFTRYAERNYLRLVEGIDRESCVVLEVGCNKGYLLTALKGFGYVNLSGVDLSPDDVAKASMLIPEVAIVCADAFDYLVDNRGEFDLIILKAVLEHVQKERIIPFLERVRGGLRPGGVVIVDVPNMDWLFAQHERYMDFTHEVGFTRESLAQVMRNVFDDVSVVPGLAVTPVRLKGRLITIVRPLVIFLLGLMLKAIGEGASDVWWHSRSIIGVARV